VSVGISPLTRCPLGANQQALALEHRHDRGGGGASAMRNQNGVTIEILSMTQGLEFTFAASGVSMKIKK
jgi:hypothetical protein